MPPAYRLIILPEAAASLEEIFTYIEQSSPQNATAVARSLVAAIDSLEHFPHRFRVHQSRRDPVRVVRSMSVPPFIVYYRIIERNQAVEIMLIRHGARRQPRRF